MYYRFTEIEATFSEVQKVSFQAIKLLPNRNPVTTRALHLALTLLLYTCAKYEEFCSRATELSAEADEKVKVTVMLKDLYRSLCDNWIVKFYSPTFGDPDVSSLHYKPDLEVNLLIMIFFFGQ